MDRARCIDQTDPMMNKQNMNSGFNSFGCPPIYEPMVERCCHREIFHEVPHIIPCHTQIINHHIFNHTYIPCYSTSECDTCEQVYNSCYKNF